MLTAHVSAVLTWLTLTVIASAASDRAGIGFKRQYL